MSWKITNMQTRLKFISALILLVGLGSAILIYLTAENDSGNTLGYEVVGGSAYPSAPENSKMYEHDLELYGGKAAVLTNEFRYWFVGLWHGRSLAFTIVCISFFISLGVFFAGTHLPSGLKSDARGENNRNGKYFKP